MEFEKKAKIVGAIGSVLFHLLVLMILLLLTFSRVIPEENSNIAMGGSSDGMSGNGGKNDFFEPVPESEIEDYSPPESKDEDYLTQNTEESAALPDQSRTDRQKEERRKQEQQKAEEHRKQLQRDAEAKAIQDKQNQKAAEIENRTRNIFSGNGSSNKSGGNGESGNGSGNGNSGSGNGTEGSGNSTGTGRGSSHGNGSGYDLTGRLLIGNLVKPGYNTNEEGKIVVRIMVDKSGAVTNAVIAAGTNISNQAMLNAALEAARKTKFNAIDKDSNQSGTITYIFKLQ